MTSKPKHIGPYASPMSSSVLETASILGQLLRPVGYTRDVIMDLSVGEFLAHERESIGSPASMHLLALKKALLYVVPIISPPGIHEGIALTSQVSCPAIQYSGKQKESIPAALSIGDKFRLIGLAFPATWTNHLAMDIFPWKQFNQQQTPLNYTSISFHLEAFDGLHRIGSTSPSTTTTAYLIDPRHYEDTALFNRINKVLIICLGHAFLETASIMASLSVHYPTMRLPIIDRMKPFNDQDYLPRLNAVLPCLITPIYTVSEYECLQMSANWRLYDEIKLFGIDSPSVFDRLSHLQYVKKETLQARTNLKVNRYQRLLQTRGEKIARERYPYYFDYTDRRAIFTRFNRFSIEKLPQQERTELSILVEKDIKAQNVLLTNQCEHIALVQYLNATRRAGTDEATIAAFRQVEAYINYDLQEANAMCPCKLCSFPLLCQHEIEFYTALESVDFSLETVDKAFLIRQRIINKFKETNRQRTGDENTEVAFTFYCKACGGELGKSDDVIQAGIRTRDQSAFAEETTPLDSSIFSAIAHIVKFNMNQTIVPTSHRSITKLIFSEAKPEIKVLVERANKLENEYLELFTRYVAFVYACSSLIAIKVGQLKTSEKILVNRDTVQSGGVASAGDIKADFVTAYKIIQANLSFKRVGVTETKAKALLIHAFKSMNRVFSKETIQIKPASAIDRLRNDILTSPITKYALFMYKRHFGDQQIDPFKVVGVDFAALVQAKKAQTKKAKHEQGEQGVVRSNSLFGNMYAPVAPKNKRDDFSEYIEESYQAIVRTAAKSPVSSTVTAPVSAFMKSLEATRASSLVKLRMTPKLNLPSENNREFDFELTNFQIGYCLDPAGPHRWNIFKTGTGSTYICKRCNLEKTKVPTDLSTITSNNRKIENSLKEHMVVDAFFELYTLSCPVKDIHEYENGKCTQCRVSKEQLESMDPSYYKEYSATYLEFRKRVTNQLLRSADDIMATKAEETIVENLDDGKVDHVKLESLGTGLSKLFGHKNLNTLGKNSAGQRVYEVVESNLRLLYSHYTFARNLSVDTTCHPDMTFYALVKEVLLASGTSKTTRLPPLPEYPTTKNADRLLADLFQIIYDTASFGDATINKLLQFIVDKMIAQESKHQMYNVGRLKTTSFVEESEGSIDADEVIVDPENEENDTLESLFQGYDMGNDDLEDNLNGEYE